MKRNGFSLFVIVLLLAISSCSNSSNENNGTSVEDYSNSIVLSDWELFSEGSDLDAPVKVKVPSTVLGSLVKSGVYKDVYFGMNLTEIDEDQFRNAWRYTTSFEISDFDASKEQIIDFEGINYRANIWINGKQIADTTTLFGVFSTFSYNISNAVKEGGNEIIVDMYAPRAGDFTMGFVDWAPVPQDKNMGLWRPVTVKQVDAVELKHTFIDNDLDLETLASADVFITTEAINHSDQKQEVELKGKIGDVTFSHTVTLEPNETKKVSITKAECPELAFKNPKLWWPVNFGEPNMYQLVLSAHIGGAISDKVVDDFGIRKFEDYFTPEGARGYKINGKEILVKGGGWVDDLLLNNSTDYNEAQVLYTKDMGLNCIRFEGFWGTSKEIYDMCDKHGLLSMVGFSCQWEWHEYMGVDDFETCDDCIGGAIDEPHEIELVADYFNDMTKWLRNNPSVFMWTGGSDRLHVPELEEKYLEILKEENPNGLFCGAAKSHVSEVTGPTGVKMYGPYDYVPPVYWYTDTVRGGAYGFNTETGPGPQPPVLSSIKRMIPEEHLWPIDTIYWNYHSGRHAFKDMHRYLNPMYERYGKPESIEEFAYITQIQSYELMKPMFESFVVNKPNTTGIIQWMLNSAWPETFWQLYDYYLHPTGAYYGAKKANQKTLVAYNYGDHSVYLANETYEARKTVKVKLKLVNLNSEVIHEQETTVSLDEYTSSKVIELPSREELPELYFVKLEAFENEVLLSDNFYWVSKKQDVMNPDPSKANWIYTPTVQNADYTGLISLERTDINMTRTDEGKEITVTLGGSEKLAFGIELTAIDKASGEPVLPVIWSDNYLFILPGESLTVSASFPQSDIDLENIEIKAQSLNTNIK